jgi:hypothetical protein
MSPPKNLPLPSEVCLGAAGRVSGRCGERERERETPERKVKGVQR